jgi:hypothetical protein
MLSNCYLGKLSLSINTSVETRTISHTSIELDMAVLSILFHNQVLLDEHFEQKPFYCDNSSCSRISLSFFLADALPGPASPIATHEQRRNIHPVKVLGSEAGVFPL